MSALNLMVVDDDDVDVMNVQRALEKAQVAAGVVRARDGEEALELLRSGRVPHRGRLVLLDLNLPRMTGIEFLHELRNDPQLKATVVVILTTSNDDRDKVEAYRFNVAGYLVKPVLFGRFVDLMVTLNRYWASVELP